MVRWAALNKAVKIRVDARLIVLSEATKSWIDVRLIVLSKEPVVGVEIRRLGRLDETMVDDVCLWRSRLRSTLN